MVLIGQWCQWDSKPIWPSPGVMSHISRLQIHIMHASAYRGCCVCVQSFDTVMAAIGTHKAGQSVEMTFQRC